MSARAEAEHCSARPAGLLKPDAGAVALWAHEGPTKGAAVGVEMRRFWTKGLAIETEGKERRGREGGGGGWRRDGRGDKGGDRGEDEGGEKDRESLEEEVREVGGEKGGTRREEKGGEKGGGGGGEEGGK